MISRYRIPVEGQRIEGSLRFVFCKSSRCFGLLNDFDHNFSRLACCERVRSLHFEFVDLASLKLAFVSVLSAGGRLVKLTVHADLEIVALGVSTIFAARLPVDNDQAIAAHFLNLGKCLDGRGHPKLFVPNRNLLADAVYRLGKD